jgi:DNA adenine methylase
MKYDNEPRVLSAWPLAILDADGRPLWHTAGTNPPLYGRDEKLEAIYMEAQQRMKAPFPYFGGKSKVAPLVWQYFGDTPNYVEPFAGSLAVLLQRPHAAQTETVNDADGMICNFWRALAADPDAVASYADWPVNECDLHARHKWLYERRPFVDGLMSDPDAYDAKIAGWWVWGICQWIGSGWCPSTPAGVPHVRDLNRKIPHVGDAGRGIHRASDAHALHRKRPIITGAAGGPAALRNAIDGGLLHTYMRALSARLRRVRVVCGDWARVCGPSVTFRHGVTAVFLDPPYDHAERQDDLYARDENVFAAAREWAIANGDNPLMRIALCGYDFEMPAGWTAHRWKAAGGYGSQGDGQGRENAKREMIWFSPHCLSTTFKQARKVGADVSGLPMFDLEAA